MYEIDLSGGLISPGVSFGAVNATGIIKSGDGILVITDESVDLFIEGRGVVSRAFHLTPTIIKWYACPE
jgi:hypothetical protein